MRNQQTIGQAITCAGVGLHTGHPVTLTLRPAPPDTGIVFVRTEEGIPVALSASVRNLVPAELCTTISTNGMVVKTVEHVLGALVGLGIDNVFVELSAGEVPVMDGSAAPFVRLIRAAGITPQDRRQPFLKIMQPIEVVDGHRRILLEPASSTSVTYSIQYDHPLIKQQTYVYRWSTSAFERDIAGARTFGFLNEVQHLWSKGLGKGGSLDNTIILSEHNVLNESGLRFEDEFVRHKILDLIGDLALLGVPFIGHLHAHRAGHALHTKLVQKVLEQPDKWILIAMDGKPASTHVKTSHPYAHLQASSC
ncbi:MAG TPA: UDP-3-O-acyl-N-acetylglucosamine deacetylase [Nitrospiraceae bacterium]|nr:UDP-3-O-acyl-N-acetylglucosamine deacetylase [Nitrospiraceae bacterium]